MNNKPTPLRNIKTKKPNKAGGLPSLASTLKHIVKSQQPTSNLRSLLKANQDKGFDCPGCAWGDQKDGLFKFCENGAKAIAWESTTKQVERHFFAEHTVSSLRKQSDYWLEYQGRLTEPMRYDAASDKYLPITWQDAYALINHHLSNLENANQAEFYTSGRASNEAAFLYQLFGRMFGTNNFPDCSNMCHEASGVALTESIGIGKGTVTLEDFDHADTIFVFGQNPGSNHPRMMNALRKAARNNCKIVSFNNLKEVALEKFASPQDPIELLTSNATNISHAYFTPTLGGDMAAIRGMVKAILETNQKAIEAKQLPLINDTFIKEHSIGFAEYQQQVEQTSWQDICQQSGLTENELRKAAEIYLAGNKVIITWAMGITQHKHSVDTIKEIVNLQLLKGNLGKKGAGLCPVRGHSNVQGNRTVGINEKPKADFIDNLQQLTATKLPYDAGHNVYHALKAFLAKESKTLICLGGNLAAAGPDTEEIIKALSNTELNVQISTKLNRSHLYMGKDALILPCLGRTEIDRQQTGEQKITVEDTFSMVHASQGNVEPLSTNLRSEVSIVAHIAHEVLDKSDIAWLDLANDYSKIRDLIEKTLPAFSGFNDKIKTPGGFYLGNSARSLTWHTQSQKAQFSANNLPEKLVAELFESNDKAHQLFTLQSLRSHDQYNTTIYGMHDRYRGIENNRKVLFIHEKDASKLGFNDGDSVDITSVWHNNQQREVKEFSLVFYDIPRGNLAAYYPETNPLVPLDSIGDKSYTPTSKAIAVYLKKSNSSRII